MEIEETITLQLSLDGNILPGSTYDLELQFNYDTLISGINFEQDSPDIIKSTVVDNISKAVQLE